MGVPPRRWRAAHARARAGTCRRVSAAARDSTGHPRRRALRHVRRPQNAQARAEGPCGLPAPMRAATVPGKECDRNAPSLCARARASAGGQRVRCAFTRAPRCLSRAAAARRRDGRHRVVQRTVLAEMVAAPALDAASAGPGLLQFALHANGSKLLLHLLAPRRSAYFLPHELAVLDPPPDTEPTAEEDSDDTARAAAMGDDGTRARAAPEQEGCGHAEPRAPWTTSPSHSTQCALLLRPCCCARASVARCPRRGNA